MSWPSSSPMASSDPDPGQGDPGRLTGSARANRAFWDGYSAEYQSLHQEALSGEPTWGLWRTPDAQLGILGDVAGLDVLELGCGGAQFALQLSARGARVTGLDNSEAQLAYARELQARAGLSFPLVHSPADAPPSRHTFVTLDWARQWPAEEIWTVRKA